MTRSDGASAQFAADQLAAAYGPFTPGSPARAIRAENWARGLRTCWQCLGGYRSRYERDEHGRERHLGSGRAFCSWSHYCDWVREHPWPRPKSEPPSPAEIVADARAKLAEARARLEAQR